MNVLIRQYKTKDFDRLAALLGSAFNVQITREDVENHSINDRKNILIAEDTDKKFVIGCAFLSLEEDYIRKVKSLYVTYVTVDNEYRKTGVGTKIFSEIINIAKMKKYDSIELTSANFRKGAHEFYKSLGFDVKKTTVFIKDKY